MTPHAHCLHEILRFDVTRIAGDGTTKVTRRCCDCGELVYETVLARRDPSHGPFAPLVTQ